MWLPAIRSLKLHIQIHFILKVCEAVTLSSLKSHFRTYLCHGVFK